MFQATHKANPVPVNAATILEATPCYDSNDNFEGAVLRLSDGRNFSATVEMCARYKPVPGDYLVTQEDGYEYLNPKDVFERKYSAIPSTHQERVAIERCEVAEKLAKLNSFFDTEQFSTIDIGEQARMRYQAVAMKEYSAVLGERIAAFK